MATLTKAWEQAKDLFNSMTPGARLTAVLLVAVIVISLGYLFTMSGDSSGEFLLAGKDFSVKEMSSIQAALGAAGLNDAKIEGTKIKVPAGEEAKYLAAMANGSALPQDFAEIMADAMTNLSPFSSREQRREAMKNAKMKALSQIIPFMDDGIAAVQVVYDETASRGISGGGTKTASVTLQMKNRNAIIEPQLAKAIRDSVTHSYAGLTTKDVSIVVNGSTVMNSADLSDPTLEGQQRFLLAQQQHEQMYAKKIRESFPTIPGITVSAYVKIDPTLTSRESTRTLSDKSGGTLSDSTSEETTTSETNPAGGRPPAQATAGSNAPLTLAGTASGTSDETSSSRSEKTTIPGHTDKLIETAGLIPTSVSVSVGVPDTFFIEKWKADNPDVDREPTEADWKPLADAAFVAWKPHVLSQISTPTSTMEADVTFTAFPSLPGPEFPEESFTDSAMGWVAQHGGTLGMVFLGFVGLMMVRSFVKTATKQPEVTPEATSDEPSEDAEDAPAAPKATRKWDASEGDVKQELAELVREDPDTAASILQGWITTPT